MMTARWILAIVMGLVLVFGAAFIPDALQVSADSPYPSPDAPLWLWSDCSIPSVTLGWYNPPEEVLPFAPRFSAYLSILGDGYGESEIMTYLGPATCPHYPGCLVYRWRRPYDLPPGGIDYTLTAYVVNEADEIFYAQPEIFDPGCHQNRFTSYAPLMVR
jgi:hypothetical protein